MSQTAETNAAPETRHRTRTRPTGTGPTRIKWAWFTAGVAILLGVALLDFLVQNTRKTRIEFFSVSGDIPTTVALLGAALVGAAVVVVIGILRMAQLRHSLRAANKAGDETDLPSSAASAAPTETTAETES